MLPRWMLPKWIHNMKGREVEVETHDNVFEGTLEDVDIDRVEGHLPRISLLMGDNTTNAESDGVGQTVITWAEGYRISCPDYE